MLISMSWYWSHTHTATQHSRNFYKEKWTNKSTEQKRNAKNSKRIQKNFYDSQLFFHSLWIFILFILSSSTVSISWYTVRTCCCFFFKFNPFYSFYSFGLTVWKRRRKEWTNSSFHKSGSVFCAYFHFCKCV